MGQKTQSKAVHHIAPMKKKCLYRNAEKLARDIDLKDDNYLCCLDGSFIYGDFLEAFFVENNLYTDELTISTLSMSENNIYNLRNLIDGGYVGKLNLIVSDHFYSHERRKLVPLLIEEVKNMKLFTVRTHTKIALFESEVNGEKKSVCISGSANLRTNGNYEQISITNCKETHDFYYNFHYNMCKGFGKRKSKNDVESIAFEDFDGSIFDF